MSAGSRGTWARLAVHALVLAAALHFGARRVGRAPPLGPFLDPWNGVWGAVATATLPERGAVELAGLSAPVQAVYDDRGVPHIFAASSEDAMRALGYLVARDRLFQMELRWRSAAGRMSEILGAEAVSFDRGMRRLALAWSAERDFRRLDPTAPVAREIAAYAAGVSAWIDGLKRRDWPLEYHLLGQRPSDWQPVYSLYLLKLMGWDLTYSVTADLARLRLRAQVGAEAAAALIPTNSPIQQPIQPNGSQAPQVDAPPIPPPGEPDTAAARLARDLELALGPAVDRLADAAESGRLASNNWAVAPGRTAAGFALLAGDPHLELTLPSIWYEVHLVVPGELDVYGVTIPSVPALIIGFNRDVAWSFTNTGADVIDYYLEQLDDAERPTHYRLDGAWQPLETRVEEYRGRRGELMARDTTLFTHRGPIVARGERALSMRWTVLEGAGATEALREAARTSTVEDWLRASLPFTAPAQNMILADRAGDIAIRSTGSYPLQPDGSGLEVRDGTTRASDWLGFWPPERYPFALNPVQGYLASANQQPIDPRLDSTYLGADWPSPWRAMRINALLAADSAVTPEAMGRYQTDPGNARADLFLPFFLAAVDGATDRSALDPDAREAAGLLGEWDRRYTMDNERALLFEYAMEELEDRTWDELLRSPGPESDAANGDMGEEERVHTPGSAVLAVLLRQRENAWWDDRRTTGAVENRDAILRASLAAALRRARRDHGEPDAGGWRWDGVRHANIYHLLQLPALSRLELAVRGGPGNLNPSEGRGTHGASWRMVVELGREVRARTIYPGGQSGNPLSRWYADRIDRWVAGELDGVLYPRTASELPATRTAAQLALRPGG